METTQHQKCHYEYDSHNLYVSLGNISEFLSQLNSSMIKAFDPASRSAIQSIQSQLSHLRQNLRKDLVNDSTNQGLESVLHELAMQNTRQASAGLSDKVLATRAD